MDYIVVTLKYGEQKADLELPISVPMFVLAPIILDSLSWQRDGTLQDTARFVGHVRESGVVVRPNETLAQAGVVDGNFLELTSAQSVTMDPDKTFILEPPVSHQMGKPHFLAEDTGEIFPCRGKSSLIGRSPKCAISLGKLPNGSVVSGRHANLVRRDNGYWISDENSTNGTIVDGYALKQNEYVQLRNGSQVQFGIHEGPVLIFYSGESE
ncbi:MAG: FHA domain-containing protein [Chloroflexi bacterium]|nr:FHA domain-containing protein [Chloroflexota bacterium]